MKYKMDNKSKRYILYLFVLLVAYYLVETLPFRKEEKTSNEIVSENIKTLESTGSELESLITSDKQALNDFFFNDNTSEKIMGLISTYSDDREFKINDNIKIFLQQEGNPVKIRYKRAEYEIVNTKIRNSEDASDDMAITYDVIVTDNPNGINNYQLIHDLKTYLVDSFGQDAFNNFLDEIIADTIKENQELIKILSKGKKE
ncbi:hypothetical protein [Anaerococcus cruorum]|uniref:Uncharacterized protein n=1 Tax=Anaerococcus cruorum TaxID=3115617 RepID=A0ABW9MX11_9FIRM